MRPLRQPALPCLALLRHLLLALLFVSLRLHAAPTTAPPQDGALLNGQAEVLIDASERLDIQGARTAAFEPLQGRTALGLVDHPVWLRVHLPADPGASATAASPWWLDLSPFSMADVQVFAPAASGWRALHTGETQPFATRPLAWRQFLVPVTLRADAPTTIYLRLRGYNTLVVPLRLWRLATWAPHALGDYLVVGACLGVMAGLALYNLLLALRLRQRIFLLYSLLVTSYALFSADLIGLGSQYLWSDAFVALPGRNQALVCLYGCFGALFPLYLLDSGSVWRGYRRVLHGVAAAYAVSTLLALAGAYAFAGVVIQLLPLLWFPLVLGVALYRGVAEGFRPAWYYLLGYGPVFVTLTLLILIGQNKVAATPLAMNAFLVAGAFEAVLFSQALAERFNLLRRERESALELAVGAKQEQLRAAEAHQAELEDRVARRTRELEASQQALQRLAYQDPLTELPNRLLFRDRLERLIAACRRDGATFTLAIVDLDGFKQVNDNHGHHAGDHLLRAVAARLGESLREMDTVARLGGDEFGILLPGLASAQVREGPLLGRLHAACSGPVRYEDALLQVGGSIGLASYGPDLADREAIYRAADRDMYRAKAGARQQRVAP
ncbi:MAG: diguanylate cyclase [Pelomonas sp.]|nr:diguanylate cyclase [Roseateles sp.]